MNDSSANAVGNCNDSGYDEFVAKINRRFHANTEGAVGLFTTDAVGLFDAYLEGFPAADRQYHNCNSCRRFIERFGGLVTINEEGITSPAFWHEDDAPGIYRVSIARMARLVRRAKVTGVFLTKELVWGTPATGPWTHLAIHAYGKALCSSKPPFQVMAEKLEDYRTVCHALVEFSSNTVEQAVALLRSEALYRSEKVLGAAEWLLALHKAAFAGKIGNNVVWRAVATAPAGFCHPRSSMVGTLLEDLEAGLPLEDVSKRFAAKMNPLQYQRPQAPPTAGNIAQAEKLFEQMGLAPALKRRIARIDEVPMLWAPKKAGVPSSVGLFGHLVPKGQAEPATLEVPATKITWEKFARTVLSTAESIEFQTTYNTRHFVVLTAAVDPTAPPILQWDHEERRNPVSWYCWAGGAPPSQYGLPHNAWVNVAGITRLPARWGDDLERFKHHGDGVILLLEGARETRIGALGIFPEHLRAELHQVRSTIEAYARQSSAHGLSEGSAVGYDLRQGSNTWGEVKVRVKAGSIMSIYTLDRWD